MKINKKYIMIFAIALLVFTAMPVHAASCVLGEQTTKDLYGILKIMRILGPLAMLVFTIFDMIKMLATGMTPAGNTETPPPKVVFGKFGKRLLGVVALFMVPTFITIIFEFAGIWDEDGKCDLSNPTANPTAVVGVTK